MSWPTGWQQQTPICSHVLRMSAHGKETPVDKKLHQIREQPSEWKITLHLLFLCCKPSQHRTDASSPHLLANETALHVKGLPCPTQMFFSHFIPYYFTPHSLSKSCSNMLTLGMCLSVRKVQGPADYFHNKVHSGLCDILAGDALAFHIQNRSVQITEKIFLPIIHHDHYLFFTVFFSQFYSGTRNRKA